MNEKTQVASTDRFPNQILMPYNIQIINSRVDTRLQNTPGQLDLAFSSGLEKVNPEPVGDLRNFMFIADLSYMKIIPSNRNGNSSVETTVELTHLCSLEGYIYGFLRNQACKTKRG